METQYMMNPGVYALFCGLSAQAFKVALELIIRRRWQPSLFVSNGGMPSSHSATVTTLSLKIGQIEGFNSSLFSLVLVFGLFVIMEATGLRQEIGHQAQLLNEMMDNALHGKKFDGKRLRELVGHTWAEVFGGIIFGVAFYFFV